MKNEKKQIIIVGARADGHAGVVLDIIKEYGLYEVIGFLDDDVLLYNKKILGVPVKGAIKEYFMRPSADTDNFFIGNGNNLFREKWHKYIKEKSFNLVNVIHPTAVVSASVSIGEGVFIGANVSITHGAVVGNGVLLNTAVTIEHDNIIEDFVNISPGSHMSGRVKIKKRAFLGSGVIAIPDIVIGEDAVVGAGSVLIRDVEKNSKVCGSPARKMSES